MDLVKDLSDGVSVLEYGLQKDGTLTFPVTGCPHPSPRVPVERIPWAIRSEAEIASATIRECKPILGFHKVEGNTNDQHRC